MFLKNSGASFLLTSQADVKQKCHVSLTIVICAKPTLVLVYSAARVNL